MDTTNIIPKEELATFQPWEPDSFDSPKSDEAPTPEPAPAPVVDHETNKPNEVELPTQEQIDLTYQKAQEEGYAAGFQAGREAGYQEGKQFAKVEMKTEVEQIRLLLAELNNALNQIDQQVAQDLLILALGLTKEMLTQALKIKPELILPIVQEAIRQLPNAMEHPCLILHPDDATLVREQLSEQLSQSDWKILEDEKIAKGGCRVEANGSEIDASIPTRWQRVLATIGQKDDWLI